MRYRRLLATVVAAVGVSSLVASDQVAVPGSSTRYPSTIEANVGAKKVKLALTGTALRTKVIIKLYAIGSYVEQGAPVHSAAELCKADCPKRLHLVMERAVEGKDLAEAFRAAIRLNYGEPVFKDEVQTLTQFLRSTSVRKGEYIYLTHVPGVGLHGFVEGKADFLIKNPHFSQAVWEIYLGPHNLGENIKRGLTSRL
jgi:hypothetical protein